MSRSSRGTPGNMTKTPLQRIQSAIAPLRYISLRQWPKFLAYRRRRGAGETEFRIRGMPHGIRCRAGTTDAVTIESVFGYRFHLPPRPLPEGAVILDLGANTGYAAAHLATRYPSARIIAVEMDEANANLARRNLAPFSNCELVHAAVWVEDGTITYGGDAEDAYAVASDGIRSAPAVTVPTLLDQRGLGRADYVKMDVEGAEWTLFQRPEWLDRVDSIVVEVHQPEWKSGIEGTLKAAGFATARSASHWSLVSGWRR